MYLCFDVLESEIKETQGNGKFIYGLEGLGI